MEQEKYHSPPEKFEARELAPEEFWSGPAAPHESSEEDFARRIGEVTNELCLAYSGYRVSGDCYLDRYPSRSFGQVAPVGKYQEASQKSFALAEKFRQARIAVDDLQDGQSHMVETRYCEDHNRK